MDHGKLYSQKALPQEVICCTPCLSNAGGLHPPPQVGGTPLLQVGGLPCALAALDAPRTAEWLAAAANLGGVLVRCLKQCWMQPLTRLLPLPASPVPPQAQAWYRPVRHVQCSARSVCSVLVHRATQRRCGGDDAIFITTVGQLWAQIRCVKTQPQTIPKPWTPSPKRASRLNRVRKLH